MPKHKNKMKIPKHKNKMKMPSTNKRSIGSISHNLLSSTSSHTSPPTRWRLKRHQQQFSNNSKLKLLILHGHSDCLLISLISTEEEEEKDETRTFRHPDFGYLVACCHELVLLAGRGSDDEEELALYNPTTKDKRTLPPPLRPPPKAEFVVPFYGLGLDPKSNDDDNYKVIRYLEYEYVSRARGTKYFKAVELFSLKTGSWKQIPYPHADLATPVFEVPPIYINGFNYWIADTDNDDIVIVSFDFAKESFPCPHIPKPPNEAYKYNKKCYDDLYRFLLAEYEGSLAFVVCDTQEKQIELWVWNFDNRSWRSVGVWALGVDVYEPLTFLKNRLFYFQDNNGELMLFDCATQKLKCIHGFCAVPPRALVVRPFRKTK